MMMIMMMMRKTKLTNKGKITLKLLFCLLLKLFIDI